MHQRPLLLRLFAAFVLAFALVGAWAPAAFAQDGTPEAVDPTPEPVVDDVTPEGSLMVFYYLCDAGEGFEWGVLGPNEGQPNVILETCGNDGTQEATFLIYPFGDMLGTPIEVTTVGGLITMLPLPVSGDTPHVISQKLPEDSLETPVTAQFDIAEDAITMVNAQEFQTGSVELYSYVCDGDPADSFLNVLNPGDALDPAPYENCTPDVLSFTITPFGEPDIFEPRFVTTFDGHATVEDVPTTFISLFAPHEIVEDGTDLEQTFEVAANETTIVVAVTYTEANGTLELTKYFCEGDQETEIIVNEPEQAFRAAGNCVGGEADFSIYPFGDKGADPVAVTTDENGFAQLTLPATEADGAHIIVEDATQAEAEFNIIKGETTTIDVYNYEAPDPEPTTGWVEIENLTCAGLTEPVVFVGDPDGSAFDVPESCVSNTSDFLIYPFGDLNETPIEVTVEGFDSVELPTTDGGSHLLIVLDGEGAEVGNGDFEIEDGLFTPIQVQFPGYGSVKLYSFLCLSDYEDSYFEVYAPGEPADLPLDCDTFDRSFQIIPFGSGDPIDVNPGPDGEIVVEGIPATDGQPHIISKNDGDVQAQFDVSIDTLTNVVSIVWEIDEDVDDNDDDTGGDDTGDSEDAEELPDTGLGAPGSDNTALLLFGLMSIGSVVGLAALRRRPAA